MDELSNCWLKPTCLTQFPEDCEVAVFIDENGDSSLKRVLKCISEGKQSEDNERYFNLTAIMFSKKDSPSIRDSINEIKNYYWSNGFYQYKDGLKKVCFHSDEIRKRKGPFSKKAINDSNYKMFILDMNELILKIPITIFSAFIDKEWLCKRYKNPMDPYQLATEFILERIINFIDGRNALLMFESRGRKEDKILLNTINLLKIKGTRYVKNLNGIKYISFNGKWLKENLQKTHFGLEIADLCAYPIYRKCINKKQENRAFDIVEIKLANYPYYKGKGLKYFP